MDPDMLDNYDPFYEYNEVECLSCGETLPFCICHEFEDTDEDFDWND